MCCCIIRGLKICYVFENFDLHKKFTGISVILYGLITIAFTFIELLICSFPNCKFLTCLNKLPYDKMSLQKRLSVLIK